MVTHPRRLDKFDLIGLIQITSSFRFGLEIGLPHIFQESDRHTLSSRLHVNDTCDHRTTDTVTKQNDLFDYTTLKFAIRLAQMLMNSYLNYEQMCCYVEKSFCDSN